MDRNRSNPIYHGVNPPVYLDPVNPLTPPLGTFSTDPEIANTPLTAEHANLLTEELRNLTVGWNEIPASNIDNQLAAAWTGGSFLPVIDCPDPGAITYTLQHGLFERKGNHAWLFINLQWSNTQPTQATEPVLVVPYYENAIIGTIASNAAVYGIVDVDGYNFGTQNNNDDSYHAKMPLTSALQTIRVVGRVTGLIQLGNAESRTFKCTIEYKHTNVIRSQYVP